MYILVKKIDTLKSKIHKGKTINEYIIYIMIADVAIKAYLVYGKHEMIDKIDSLKEQHNINDTFYETN
jgi:hypothetical protein